MRYIAAIFILMSLAGRAQVTVSPQFPTADEEITITYDATQGTTGLVGSSSVFMHAGVVLSGPSGTGWQNVKGEWGNPASVGQMTSLGNNKWQIKITPRQYFGVADDVRIYRIGMVFRSGGPCGGFAANNTACKEGKTANNGDFFIDIFEGNTFVVQFTNPTDFPIFKNTGETIEITAVASKASDLILKVDGVTVASSQDATNLTHVYTVSQTSGTSTVVIQATEGSTTVEDEFAFVVRTSTVNEARPAGIKEGINYHTDATKVTLCLLAPGKSSVYVAGDFTNWDFLAEYQMKKDGEHFWIEISGLTPGVEYGYQYLVNESLRLADPYSDKILSPDDQWIPESTYPNLKEYPEKALTDKWYYNRVSVLQTNQTKYQWQTQNYTPPAKRDLVIYELLVRDFFGEGEKNYQNMIDTLSYLKRLGVNAIELMPIMEFSGNESWGYNPNFMFAPDKAYGTKDKLKEFVDSCHAQGIAVILDIALNHQDIPNPYVLMDFNFSTFKPNPTNPWFNVDATHPFSVFFDMNHESEYTKKYVDTVNHYWLSEYGIDGYRFDLSKGFTQTQNPNNIGAWSAKDDSRIALLKRMADEILDDFPEAILILEHLADNTEEKILADYGFLMWGNLNHAYAQNTMGYSSGSDVSWSSHVVRGWEEPNVVSYMESHDEERLVYRNLQSGNSSGSYSIRQLDTALDRIKTASTLYFAIPGPKMLWQFGELGYDFPINYCPDGSVNNDCRVSPKPVRWDYYDDPSRKELYDHFSRMIEIKKEWSVFETEDFQIIGGTSLQKQVVLKNTPYTTNPTSVDEMNAVVGTNFDVLSKVIKLELPHTGTWYDYFNEESVNVTTLPHPVTLPPGGYVIYTDHSQSVTSAEDELGKLVKVYPNPGRESITVRVEGERVITVTLTDLLGRSFQLERQDNDVWNVSSLPIGLYLIHAETPGRKVTTKFFKR